MKHSYGFNGKENDNGVGKGTGGQQDYGMRIYDARVGRFLSVDPLTMDYPWNSTYAFAENRVISGVDLDGGEYLDVNGNAAGPLNEAYAKKTKARLAPGFKLEPILKLPAGISLMKIKPKDLIAMPDIYGNGLIGEKSNILRKDAQMRQAYKDAVGDNIRGGLFGAIGYYINGDEGTFIGAATDNILMSVAGSNSPGVFPVRNRMAPYRFRPIEVRGTIEPIESITIELQMKKDWSVEQQAEARVKIANVNSLSPRVVSNPASRPSKLRARFIKMGGQVTDDQDVDHILDLQLGGTNDFFNLQGLNFNVNRSFGPQIQNQIKDLKPGTKVKLVIKE